MSRTRNIGSRITQQPSGPAPKAGAQSSASGRKHTEGNRLASSTATPDPGAAAKRAALPLSTKRRLLLSSACRASSVAGLSAEPRTAITPYGPGTNERRPMVPVIQKQHAVAPAHAGRSAKSSITFRFSSIFLSRDALRRRILIPTHGREAREAIPFWHRTRATRHSQNGLRCAPTPIGDTQKLSPGYLRRRRLSGRRRGNHADVGSAKSGC